MLHQYVERDTGAIRTERLFQDRLVGWLYDTLRESAPAVFRALTGGWVTRLLGHVNYDLPLAARLTGTRRFLRELRVDLSECVEPADRLDTPRKVFERRIRYWDCRPMPGNSAAVGSPADARALVGSLQDTSRLFLKEKFFRYEELLSPDRPRWIEAFRGGDFTVFRLTPDRYHYNHVPVAGRVLDFYEIEGAFHACHPASVVALATPYSKNRRVVTIIDTEVAGGTGVGLVAMVEVVALMIGQVVQCYSEERYDSPRPVLPGLFVRRGQPKSLYRPGSSTDVLLFQRGRIEFADDLVRNLSAAAESRFSLGFGRPLVETDVRVRSLVAWRAGEAPRNASEHPLLLSRKNGESRR
jgi:phosphatidylserine decarboxylase